MNIVMVLLDIGKHFIRQRPFEEIELTYGRIHIMELDALPPTEWVKHLLAIRLQVGLVRKIYYNMVLLLRQVGNVILLGVICDEPINQTE